MPEKTTFSELIKTLFNALQAEREAASKPKPMPPEPVYDGYMAHNEEPKWRGGYGVPRNSQTPDFVKRDDDTWLQISAAHDQEIADKKRRDTLNKG